MTIFIQMTNKQKMKLVAVEPDEAYDSYEFQNINAKNKETIQIHREESHINNKYVYSEIGRGNIFKIIEIAK